AARTWGDDFDRVAGAQGAASLDERLDTLAEPEGATSAWMTTIQTPGRGQQARAVEPQTAFRLGAVHPPQSHAAAEPAGAARAVDQLVAQHGQRIFDLERFDRQVRGVGHVNMDAVEPILPSARAGAAADGFEIDPETPVRGVDPGEARGRART